MTMITRDLEWWPNGATEPRTIRASVGLPERHPSLGYQCTLTLEGFARPYSGTFHDAEGMLALTHTLNILPHIIEHLVRATEGGQITSRLRLVEDLDLLEAERVLEYFAPGASAPVPIRVTISPPFQKDEAWSCLLTISGFGDEHVSALQHEDTIGAISEALYLAPIALRRLVEPGGRLMYRGSEDLGFPVRPGG